MKEQSKTKQVLIQELASLRQRISQLERSEAERKQPDDELRVFAELVDASPASITVHDFTGRFLYANQKTLELHGYTKDKFLALNLRDLDVPESAQMIEARMKVLAEKGEVSFEVNHFRKDGSAIPLLVNARITRWGDAKVILSIASDLTARKLAEEQLRESEARYRSLFENNHAVMLLIDPVNAAITDANPAACAYYGWSLEALKKRRIDEINTLTREEVSAEMELARSEKRNHFFFKHRRADGTIRDVEVYSGPIPLKGKALLCSIVHDITDRMRAEDALQQMHRRLDEIIEHLPDATLVIDREGKVIAWNRAIEKMTLIPKADMIGKGDCEYAIPFYGERRRLLIDLAILPDSEFEMSKYDSVHRDGDTLYGDVYVPNTYGGQGAYLWGTASKLRDVAGNIVGAIESIRDITDRKRAEEAIRESEMRYRQLVMNAPAAIYEVDYRNRRFISFNDIVCTFTGYSREELMQMDPWELFTEESQRTYLERIRLMGDGMKVPASAEYEIRKKDGYTLWAMLNTDYTLDDGLPVSSRIVAHDITERKRIEEALHEQEIKLSSIFRAAPVGIGVVVNRVFQEANDMLCQMTGYSREELLGQNSRMLYPTQEDYDYVGQEKYRQIGERGAGTVETRWQKKDGMVIDIILSSTPLDPDDLAKGVTFTALDITERKQVEGSLRESEERFRALSENAPDIIYTMNLLGAITYVNPSWKRILGHDEEEILGRYFIEFAKEEDKRTYKKLFKSIRDEGKSINNYIGIMLTKDEKERVFNMNSAFNLDSQGRILGIVGSMKDVTELRDIEKKLSQAEKMEAIGTLAGGIAHDFNNILGAILGYTQLAIDAPDEERRMRYLNQVLKSGERAKNLTGQILTFSRQDKQERSPIEVGGIVNEAMKLLRSLLPTTIEIRQEIESKPNIVLSNSFQIHQVLMNLCTNAAHAMRDKGGALQVCLDHIELPAGENSMIVDLQPGSYIRMIVRDTGHGIDPGIIDRIFDPFFTTKKLNEGTGLGLSVVYGIVKSHSGTITVQSEPGKGSTFSVYFPRIEQETEQKSEKPQPIPGGSERVLFVDDEPFLADIGKDGLSALGYEVTVRTSSIEALDVFRTQPRTFDIVITDMTMPNMTGVQLADEILKVRPDIPVILCTGYSELIDEASSKKFGIRAFLMKPVRLEEMARTIREVLDKSNEV